MSEYLDTTPETLSSMLRIATLRSPAEKSRSSDVEPHISFIYQSRVFKGSIWTINTILLIEWVLVCFFFSHVDPDSQSDLLLFLGPSIVGGGVLLYTVLVAGGMFSSKTMK